MNKGHGQRDQAEDDKARNQGPAAAILVGEWPGNQLAQGEPDQASGNAQLHQRRTGGKLGTHLRQGWQIEVDGQGTGRTDGY